MAGTDVTRETPGGHGCIPSIAVQETIHGGVSFFQRPELQALLFEIVKRFGNDVEDGLVDGPQCLGKRA